MTPPLYGCAVHRPAFASSRSSATFDARSGTPLTRSIGGLRTVREIETEQALGSACEGARERPVATLGAIARAWISASVAGRPAATARFRASLLQRFVDFVGEDTPAAQLTTGLLSSYATHLRAAGIRSVPRYVGVVDQLWQWAHNRGDTWPGIPSPRRITGADNVLPLTVTPIATDTRSRANVDEMLHALTPEGALVGLGKVVEELIAWAPAAGPLFTRVATNAMRARWESTISGAASYTIAKRMVGQAGDGDHDAYVAMGNPEASPYWGEMVRALEAVPGVGGG